MQFQSEYCGLLAVIEACKTGIMAVANRLYFDPGGRIGDPIPDAAGAFGCFRPNR